MNDDVIVPASRKNGEIPHGRIVQIAQWSTESMWVMMPDSLTRYRTGWIKMQPGGRTSEH